MIALARLKAGEKTRCVACILWVEDMEALYGDRWLGRLYEYLDGLTMKCVISPVHDKDVYTYEDVEKWKRNHCDEDGDILPEFSDSLPKIGQDKKAHVHIMFQTKGPRDREFFTKLMAPFIQVRVTKWEKIDSYDAHLCYFVHKFTPTKYRYSELAVVGFGGIDLSPLERTDEHSKIAVLCDIQKKIQENGYSYYHQLTNWAFHTGVYDYISCVTGRASYFIGYFNSIHKEEQDAAAKRKAKKEKDAQK